MVVAVFQLDVFSIETISETIYAKEKTMRDKNKQLTCPGIVIGTKIDRESSKAHPIFGKSRPGDEFWIFQGKFVDGTRTTPDIIPIRNGRGMWVGLSDSEEELGSSLSISFAKTDDEIENLLWILRIIIGMVSGYETSVDFNPPKLGPEYDRQAPGERIAVLRIGEMRVK